MDTKEKSRSTGQKRPVGAGTRAGTTGALKTARTSQTQTRRKAGTADPKKRKTATASTSTQRRGKTTVKKPAPEVVYTQPVPFNRYRFLIQLATVVAVVLALLFGMSIFFKVEKVTVIGNEKYSAWDIRQASGIKDGENLLSVSEAKISNSITSKLPYVNKVRVGIKLPDTVKLEIVELDVVYSVEDVSGNWWLMRSDGGIVEKVNQAEAEQHTKVLGIKLEAPEIGKPGVAAQSVEQTEDAQTVPVTVLASEQLQAAISIIQYLEDNGVIGEVESLDVSDTTDLELWYGSRFQVTLGDTLELGYKIKMMKSAVSQMGDYQSGVLDVSFTIKPDEVIYTPF